MSNSDCACIGKDLVDYYKSRHCEPELTDLAGAAGVISDIIHFCIAERLDPHGVVKLAFTNVSVELGKNA